VTARAAHPPFGLDLTVRSGQFFRYRADGGGFVLVDGARVLRCRQGGEGLPVDGAAGNHARRLLGLDADHAEALDVLASDRRFPPLLEIYGGMRVMRQDPWQCLVSFVCSAMSNVKRIQANVEGIAAAFGEAIPGAGVNAFPPPQRLPKGALRPIRLGWREKYIEELFATVDEEWLGGLAGKPFEEARAALVELPGVGVKVAECVMAFSLGFGESCPVDVWIRRIARRHFFGGKRATDKQIAARLRRKFGKWTALAQQILFQAGRDGRL
jgi:N-glycosylase/DNA lyase